MTQTRRLGLTPVGKISVPAAGPDHLARPRCTGVLDQAVRDRRLVLVAAPAGYGKTSLLAEWAAGTESPVAWLSLDPLDDSPARLVRVLTDAVLAALAEELDEPADPAPATAGLGPQVDALVGLLDGVERPPVIVLDDVHHLSALTGRAVLTPLMQYARTRFVLAGRHDASIPVQRLRIAGELAEIRMGTLAFTQDEVHRLGRSLGSPRHPDGAHELWSLTGGWPVAVRLALAAGVPDGDDPLGMRDRDIPLTDYLVEQVVGQLPDDLARFFLTASFAPALDTAMAEALLPGGAGLLETCYRRGLFLVATAQDGGAPAYRWHSLVAAHARTVLTRRDPGAAQAAHRVIAEHLARSDPAGAIQHALDARSPALAASVLGEHWPDLVVRGEADLIRRLRSALPAPFRNSPDVLIALSAADAIGGDPGTGDRRPATVVGLVQTFLARCRPGPEEAIRRGTALLAEPELDEGTLALGLYLLARAELQRPLVGDGPVHRVARAAELAAARGWTALELACRAEEAVAAAQHGDYLVARRRATAVIAQAEAHGWAATGIVAGAHLAAGMADYWQDRLDGAAAELTAAIESAGPLRREVALHAAGVLAVVAIDQADPVLLDRAVAALAEQDRDDSRLPGHAAALRAVVEAFRLDSQQRPADALAVVEPWLARMDPSLYAWRGDALRRTGDLPGAWRSLDEARRTAETWPPLVRHRIEVAVQATEALLHRDPQAAHQALERALSAAAEQDLIRPLRDRSADLRPLLSEHLTWGSAHEDTVTRLLLADQAAPVVRPSAWELTPRERDVLVCLRSSLTTEEIAASMFLSINTIKTHMRAIYRKLGVAGRREAVRTGVERGLV